MPNNTSPNLSFQPATKEYSFSTNPNSPFSKIKEKIKQLNPLLLLTIEIFGLIIFFVVFLLILNFFNILSLSKLYPNQFGFLPHLTQTQQTTNNNQQTNPTAIPTISDLKYDGLFVSCPVDKTQCQDGKSIDTYDLQTKQLFRGIEYKTLKPDTNILAVTSGDLRMENIIQDGQKLLQIEIKNNQMNILAQYFIPEEDFNPIASSGSVLDKGVLGIYKSKSSTASALLLGLQVIGTKNYIPIGPAKDGSGINR